jgi:hypothetical protein
MNSIFGIDRRAIVTLRVMLGVLVLASLADRLRDFTAFYTDVGVLSQVEPRPGILILSSNCVARMRAWLNSYYGERPENWMAHTQPSAIVAHVYYIYDIPPEQRPT